MPRTMVSVRRWLRVGAVAVSAVLAVAGAVVAVTGSHGGRPVVASTTATTTIVPGGANAGEPDPALRAQVIWPASPTPYYEVAQAAQAYAVGFLGMGQPLVAAERGAPTGRREVDLREGRGPAVTTIALVRLPGQPWWSVIGTTARDVVLGDPGAGEVISSPVYVHGLAALPGQRLEIDVREDGRAKSLGHGSATSGRRGPAAFDASVSFGKASVPRGTIVVVVRSASTGRTLQAAVQRVTFDAGR